MNLRAQGASDHSVIGVHNVKPFFHLGDILIAKRQERQRQLYMHG